MHGLYDMACMIRGTQMDNTEVIYPLKFFEVGGINIQLLPTETLGMMRCKPENNNIDRHDSQVNTVELLWLKQP